MSSEFFTQFGPNAGLVEEQYRLFLVDPGLVDESWASFFAQANGAVTLNGSQALSFERGMEISAHPESKAANRTADSLTIQERVTEIIAAYRSHGHFRARINPLTAGVKELPDPGDISSQFSNADLQHTFVCSGFRGQTNAVLKDLLAELQQVYCGSVGFEFEHLSNLEERLWFRRKVETEYVRRNWFQANEKKRFARILVESEAFDAELHRKYVGSKRFSLQGGKTLIPMLDSLVCTAATQGVREAVLGMAHRGRLNVLVSLLGKPFRDLFSEFEDKSVASVIGAGDVKYHLGYCTDYQTIGGQGVGLSLAPNPSHLEFVNPIVEGIVRAKQDLFAPNESFRVLPILIHGDAAFAGQGVVYETLNFSKAKGYDTAGTVHVVINNQVGFTTDAAEARSSAYCTDLCRGIDVPVFHVNAEDVEAACWVMKLAAEFRREFARDVVIDLLCFRRFGHNEGDDPSFTQPLMYNEIKHKRAAVEIYADQLIGEGICTQEEVEKFKSDFLDPFNAAKLTDETIWLGEACGLQGRLRDKSLITAVDKTQLEKISSALISYPEGFVPHPKLKTILEKRAQTLIAGEGIEWGFAEALAFGSLVLEGARIRLSGQDCGRGTFSHRHAELHHYEKDERYYPLANLGTAGQGNFEVYNSTLSEAGVLGFEFGYASENQDTLVLWEAQFGDFANGAQVIIDQFISSSESKWGQRSGVVLLLPHGYEGQGPEHSSARLERYLQLCAEGNMSVCYPTTAAQYFHLLRRQGRTEIRRPLIIMTPKSLLRFPEASSNLSDLTSGGFQPVISEDIGKGKPEHIVLVSGKVFYDVRTALQNVKVSGVRVLRLEELYPFPERELRQAINGYKGNSFSWVQEEPKNMGAWRYMDDQCRTILGIELKHIGRPESASTAAGSTRWHGVELKRFLDELLATVKS